MTTSQHPPVVVDSDFDVLIIHGVGNPGAGDLARPVIETLKRTLVSGSAIVNVIECNWNQIVEPSARGGVILGSAWEDLSMSLAHASAIGDGLDADNWPARFLRVLAALSLMFAELGLAAALAALLMISPLLLVFAVLTSNEPLFWTNFPSMHAFAGGSLFAACCALALLVLLGLARTLALGVWTPLFVELRRALLLVLRPFLILGACFFLIPWRSLASREGWRFISLLARGFIPILVMGALISRWNDPRSFTWSEFGSAVLASYGLMAGLSTAVFAIAFITVRTIAPSLKVLLDIFRYIGSSTYREKIQLHLNGVICERFAVGAAPRPTFIVSHSLGTVIALHSLLSSEEWDEDARITLITLGSPIRRFFMRFFPGLFFPASIATAAAEVAARVGRFRWINCYRPLDQVGAALGFSGIPYARDISTNQWGRIWDAHPDYWSDDRVARVIWSAILETPMHSADALECEPLARRHYTVTQWVDVVEKFRQAVSAAILHFVAIAILVAFPVAMAVVAWSNYSLSLSKAAEAGVIEATGISTLAVVTHWRETVVVPNAGASFTDYYEITYKSLDGQAHETTIRYFEHGAFEKATYQANVDALFNYVKSHCSDVDPRPLRRIELRSDRRYRCENVRLRYDLNAPDHFVLLDFPAKRTWWDVLRDSAWQLVITILFLGSAGSLIILISGGLISTILGVEYFAKFR